MQKNILTELLLEDVTCARCGERLEAVLGAMDGVVDASVDWENGTARVRHDERCDPDQFVRAVEEASRGTIHQYRARVVPAARWAR